MEKFDVKKIVIMNLVYLVIKGLLLYYASVFFPDFIGIDSFVVFIKVYLFSELSIFLAVTILELYLRVSTIFEKIKANKKDNVNLNKKSDNDQFIKALIIGTIIIVGRYIFGYIELYLATKYIEGFTVNGILTFVLLGFAFSYYQIWLPTDTTED